MSPLVDVHHSDTMVGRIIERMHQHPEHDAFLLSLPASVQGGDCMQDGAASASPPRWVQTRSVTSSEFLSHVEACAAWLLNHGVEVGERIGLMAPSCYAWTVADCAVQWVGAVVVPLYETASAEQVASMCERTEVTRAFGTPQTRRILQEAGLSAEHLWHLDPEPTDLKGCTAHAELSASHRQELDERQALLDADTPATIVFTSGTTGQSQPAVITNRNMLSQVLNVAAAYRDIVHDRGATLIFLPLAHILARGLQCVCLTEGMRISYEPSPRAVLGALEQVRPTFMVTPPRLLEKIIHAMGTAAADRHLGGLWSSFYHQAIEHGRQAEVADLRAHGLQVPEGTLQPHTRTAPLRWWLGSHLFGRLLHAKLGGRMTYLLSGAAPLAPEVSWFFRGVGISVVEGYGLTETTAPATGNRPGMIKSGTVGPVIPGTTVRIDDDGHVLLTGAGVFRGYLDGSGRDADGFFDTGDLGSLDADGYLTIIGRAKNLLITSYGKNISPDAWQAALDQHPLVDCSLVIGEARPYVTALVILDATVPQVQQAQARALPASDLPGAPQLSLITDPALCEDIRQAVERTNATVSRPEQVKDVRIVRCEEEGLVMTATRKLRRPLMEAACAQLIEEMYA